MASISAVTTAGYSNGSTYSITKLTPQPNAHLHLAKQALATSVLAELHDPNIDFYLNVCYNGEIGIF